MQKAGMQRECFEQDLEVLRDSSQRLKCRGSIAELGKSGDDVGAYIVRATNSTIPSRKRSPAPNDRRNTEYGIFHTIGGSYGCLSMCLESQQIHVAFTWTVSEDCPYLLVADEEPRRYL